MKKFYFLAAAFFFANTFNAQVHYSENFESGNGANWKYTDLDGDGNNFAVMNVTSLYNGFGTKSMTSFSWNNKVLYPDNLVTSTPITLPAGAGNLFLKYSLFSQLGSYGAEHYAVYISTNNTPADVIATTPVLEETLPFEGGLQQKTIDLSAYAGQTVYLSYRHFNCVDQYVFSLDNISIETLPADDAKLASASIDKYIAVNSQNEIIYNIKNNGSTIISSIELNWNDGTDHIATAAANIAPGQSAKVSHPTKVSYNTVTSKAINLNISKVNNAADPTPADNTGIVNTTVASQVVPKKVVFEEGTGTWCGWCPRGMVALEKVNQDYPNDQISIAVHGGSSNEPMQVAGYVSGAGFTGFPGMNVDRELKGVDPNPSTINSYVIDRKNTPTPVKLSGDFTITGDQLKANVNSKFFMNQTGANFRLAVVVVEDGVKGTTTAYNQSNYYAGGANGPMGGFENKPSTVPAAQMVYDHVARALLGGYAGQSSSVPTAITDGLSVDYTFNYTIPATYKQDKLGAVLLLIDSNDGTILNATKLTKTDLAVTDIKTNVANIALYPNPAKFDFNLKLAADGSYNITIYDISGKVVKDFGAVKSNSKAINLPINLTPGKYFVNISQDGNSSTKELLVK